MSFSGPLVADFSATVAVGGHNKKKLYITADTLQLLVEQLVSAFNTGSENLITLLTY